MDFTRDVVRFFAALKMTRDIDDTTTLFLDFELTLRKNFAVIPKITTFA